MAKRGLGKFVAFAAISGAVAAGVSYVLQYKIYHKELDKDFREFEDEEDDEDDTVQEDTYDPRKLNRNYISLNSSKDEFKMAAKDMAAATKNVLKDAGNLFSDTAHEAVSAAVDTAHIALHSMKAKKDEFFEEEDSSQQPGKVESWLLRKFGSEKLDKILMGFALVTGIALPVALFILLPTLLAGFLPAGSSSIVRNLLEGVVRILIFLAFIIVTSKQSDIKRTYMYHGAEHKTIACYEKGWELTVDNIRRCSRFHPRCGTSFLFVVMIISILVFSVFTWQSPWVRMALRLLLLPLVVGISYEINRWVGRHDNWLSMALRAPGLFLQRFTTNEPDDSMMEVAIEAIRRVIPENQGEDRW